MPGTLEHSPADIIRQLLVDLAYGTATDWPIYATSMPDDPDDCIVVYDTAGLASGRIMASGEVQRREGIMIHVRSLDPDVGWTKANAIATGVENFEDVYDTGVTIGSSSYTVHALYYQSGPFSIGYESPESKRTIHSINYTVIVRQTA